MTWKPIPQQRRTVDGPNGTLTLDYLRSPDSGGEGGHEVTFPDDRRLRVLPDGRTTTKKRSHTILSGLTTLQYVDWKTGTDTVDDLDPLAYILGLLLAAGADMWEIAGPRSTPEEIISDVLADGFKGSDAARKVLREIEEAGYKITVTEGG